MKEYYRKFQGRGPDSLMHRNLRLCTEEGLFATPWSIVSVPGNVFLAALLTSVLGVSESAYGWIVSLPAWANALQLLSIPWLSRYVSARNLTLWFSTANALLWLLFVSTVHLIPTESPQLMGRLLILYFLLISFTLSISAVSWMSWIQEWIPERVRGKYFGKRNRAMGLISVAFILLAGETFARMGESLLAFQALIGVCVLLRLLSIYLISHIYTPWSKPEPMIHADWRSRYGDLLKPGGFRSYLIFAALLAFGFSIVGPFAPVFMTQFLDFSIGRQTHLLILASMASALAMPFWGRLCDRFGCRPVIITTGILWMVQNYLWVILTPQTVWLLYPMWLWGGGLSGGVILGGFNLILKLTPVHLKSAAISLHLAVTSIAAAIAPVLAGLFLSMSFSGWLESTEIRYRLLFFLQPTWVLLSFFVLVRVAEPKSADLSSFSGAFRTMRNVMVQSGVMLVANFTFFRRENKSARSRLDIKKAGDPQTTDLENQEKRNRLD